MASKQVRRKRKCPVGMVAAVVVSMLLSMVSTYAQETENPGAVPFVGVNHFSERLPKVAAWRYTAAVSIREQYRFQAGSRIILPLDALSFSMPSQSRGAGGNRQQPRPASGERSTRSKVLGGIVGGVGGFFGGLFLGAAIEGDRCNCDDPGFLGALIGAPIGGVAGSVLGYKFLF